MPAINRSARHRRLVDDIRAALFCADRKFESTPLHRRVIELSVPERRGHFRHARAGPLPGGGFYGPPNVNIRYINSNGAR